MKLLLPTLLSLLLIHTASAATEVHVSTSGSAPTDDLVWSLIPEAPLSNYNWKAAPERRDTGPSFKAPSSGEFNSITLKLAFKNDATAGTQFELNVYETGAFNENPTSSAPVSSSFGILPTTLNIGDYITFTLAESVSMTENKYYSFIFNYADDVTSGAQLGFVNGAGTTADSQIWYSDVNGENFTRIGNSKMMFYVATIPEPGSVALMGLSAGVLILAAKRARAGRNTQAR